MFTQDISSSSRCEVYWIYDDTCADILFSGYVGVSKNSASRFRTHIRKKRVPPDSKMAVVFTGTRADCFRIEKAFRPEKGIGWNNAVGGAHGWRIGFNHSQETREVLKSKWTEERKEKQSSVTVANNKSLIGQKRPKQSASIGGVNNPMFGKKHSENARSKMSISRKGKATTPSIE